MFRSSRSAKVSIMLALIIPSLALAHHTFVTRYDGSKVLNLAGTVTSVSYVNPHIEFGFAAKGTNWSVETESISVARSRGLTEDRLKAGARASLSGWPARDGSARLGLRSITISGRTITMRRTAR